MQATKQTLTVTTPLGQFQIWLDIKHAPATANYFKHLAVTGLLDKTSIFRIVNSENNSHNPDCPIHVVQGGLSEDSNEPLPSIGHETTHVTGKTHKKWTVSAARAGVGETYGSFFIAMEDEPSLDFGGQRHPDRQGFAAFGDVISGFSVLEEIFQRAEAQEYLQHKIPIMKVRVE